MARPNDLRGGDAGTNLRFASVLVVLAIAVVQSPDVVAQGKGNGNQGASGGGAVVGAPAGTPNRGGAAGVSNPSPGSDSAGIGNIPGSGEPRNNETSRDGYLGGRIVDPVTPPPPGVITQSVARFGGCPPVDRVAGQQGRMVGDNVGRLDAVAQLLARNERRASTARFLLADMQAELEKTTPDAMLIGTYLGVATDAPVTPELVREISSSLCAPVAGELAESISSVAETQRKRMASGNSASADSNP